MRYYKDIFSPMTLYEIEMKRKREKEEETSHSMTKTKIEEFSIGSQI
jgi:hypothetical protein